MGETISKLGSTVSAVIVPLVAVVTLHAAAFIVGLLSAAAWLPWLVIGLPAGAWVDRLARRPVMLAADAVSLALFTSVLLAAWLVDRPQLAGANALSRAANRPLRSPARVWRVRW